MQISSNLSIFNYLSLPDCSTHDSWVHKRLSDEENFYYSDKKTGVHLSYVELHHNSSVLCWQNFLVLRWTLATCRKFNSHIKALNFKIFWDFFNFSHLKPKQVTFSITKQVFFNFSTLSNLHDSFPLPTSNAVSCSLHSHVHVTVFKNKQRSLRSEKDFK